MALLKLEFKKVEIFIHVPKERGLLTPCFYCINSRVQFLRSADDPEYSENLTPAKISRFTVSPTLLVQSWTN